MLFNSYVFLVFFPIVLLMYFILPVKIKNYWLLVASYYFYMSWNPKYGLLLLGCTLVSYFSARLVSKAEDTGKKKMILAGTLIVVFGCLIFFKYLNFFADNISRICSIFGGNVPSGHFDIVLPVGISFFSFQAVGYLVDVYRGDVEAEKNFFKYALFVSFFPQLVAGPIERSRNLLKQFDETYRFDWERARDGLFMMLWGYFLKLVVADRIAIFVDSIFEVGAESSGAQIALATVLFAFQIYGDFGGYSIIAIGAAKILGIELMENFNAPYLSLSTKEFWNRWHISLNTWFRDYLYIPLGGNRKGKVRKYLNIMITFLVSGLWHGASWSYVLWGGLNGLYQIIGELTSKIRKRCQVLLNIDSNLFCFRLLKVLGTFILVDFAWLFFRADGIEDAFLKVRAIFTDFRAVSLSAPSLYEHGLDEKNFGLMIVCIVFVILVDLLKKKGYSVREFIFGQSAWFRVLCFVAGVSFILLCGIWGSAYNANSFIYFQF